MDEALLETYWNQLPIGKENAVTRSELASRWGVCERSVRALLHELSHYDNGDDYILIRSSKNKGFYRTSDPEDIEAYRNECINKGRSNFAPLRKINRVIASIGESQFSFENNMRLVRTGLGLKQTDVVEQMLIYDPSIDCSMLSKMESGKCFPTPFQLFLLCRIYGCKPDDLVNTEVYQTV